MALYHKYRPADFGELVGQAHIKEILTNALRQNKVGHAYLFAGARGLGKTTTARLLAKSLNCLNNQEDKSKPCNRCQICQAINRGQALDVLEIDAASNRGIDEIRELKERIKFAPSTAAKKIYIIDEVHMLTKEAFNALLKTLEEPPEHAIFILATTEPHKLPATILSRVQRFDFRRPNQRQLVDYLVQIANQEKIKIDEPALDQLARLAQGSYRDALVLLEQVSFHQQGTIHLEQVLLTLGLPSIQAVEKFIQALKNKKLAVALKTVDEIVTAGQDVKNFIEITINQLRRLIRQSPDSQNIRLIKELLATMGELSFSPDQSLPLELAVYRLIGDQKLDHQIVSSEDKKRPSTRQLNSRVNQLEEKSSQQVHLKTKKKAKSADLKERAAGKIEVDETVNFSAGKDSSQVDPAAAQSAWQKIIRRVQEENPSLAGLLASAVFLTFKSRQLEIAVKYTFYRDLIMKMKNRRLIEKIGLKIFSRPVNLKCRVESARVSDEEKKQDEFLLREAKKLFAEEG